MQSSNQGFKVSFILISFIYLVVGIFFLKYYEYEGLNSNTVGYLSVALEYARGNFNHAVNGFWPPLISWLIVPFIKIGVTPLFAGKIVMLVAGLFLLVGVKELSNRFDISSQIRIAILIMSVPISLSYTKIVFPDILILCILVFYLAVVFKSDYHNSVYNGVLCGLLGAFAYFAKHYALPFFISHFLLINILHYFRNSTKDQKRNVLRNAVVGFAVFSIFCGIWIGLISSKYGYFTIGTAGKYNLVKLNPELDAVPGFLEVEKGDPVYWAGLLKPSYDTAISTWDDPTYASEEFYSEIMFWNDPVYVAKHIAKNIFRVIKIFISYFSVLTIPIILAYVLFCIQLFRKLIARVDILYPLLTLGLYSSGYMITVIYRDTVRYFWLDNILLMLMGGYLLTFLFKSEFFHSKTRKNFLLVLFAMSFIAMPIKELAQKSSYRGVNNYAIFKKLESQYDIHGNIASNDKWGFTLDLAYYYKLDEDRDKRIYYYGMPKQNQSNEELMNELKTHNIDYYLVWGESEFIPGYKDITGGNVPGLKIYSIRKAG